MVLKDRMNSIILFMVLLVLMTLITSCETVKLRTIVPTTFSINHETAENNIEGEGIKKENNSYYVPQMPAEYDCFDSDYAKDYYTKGICYDKITHEAGIQDYCADSRFLEEFYCSNDAKKGCFVERVYCNESCKEGMCIRKILKNPLQ